MDLFEKSHTTGKCDEFKKELKLKDLIMLGIGAIIGTGYLCCYRDCFC